MELYIVSEDYIGFEEPIKVLEYKKINVLKRKCLYVELERGLDYTEYGFSRNESNFILVDRHFHNRLHNLKSFPVESHLFIPIDKDNPTKGYNKWEDLFNAAWVNLYDGYNNAKENLG